jgi:hypothetical protein
MGPLMPHKSIMEVPNVEILSPIRKLISSSQTCNEQDRAPECPDCVDCSRQSFEEAARILLRFLPCTASSSFGNEMTLDLPGGHVTAVQSHDVIRHRS